MHLLLSQTNTEVTLIELIGNVPAQGSKLPSLLHQSMEETQPKEKLAPETGFVAAVKEGRVRDGVVEVRTEEIGSQSLGRFVGHFHPWRMNVQDT